MGRRARERLGRGAWRRNPSAPPAPRRERSGARAEVSPAETFEAFEARLSGFELRQAERAARIEAEQREHERQRRNAIERELAQAETRARREGDPLLVEFAEFASRRLGDAPFRHYVCETATPFLLWFRAAMQTCYRRTDGVEFPEAVALIAPSLDPEVVSLLRFATEPRRRTDFATWFDDVREAFA